MGPCRVATNKAPSRFPESRLVQSADMIAKPQRGPSSRARPARLDRAFLEEEGVASSPKAYSNIDPIVYCCDMAE
jgi:hypothetical protein